jgi:Cof subfamily protein (haloacid dehalogenase superfamily)
MIQYKVVFLDIDGTILRPDDTIESSTMDAISQLQKKGVEVVLATGRPFHEIKELGNELSITSFIAYNGAYAIHQGKEIFKETMSSHDVETFLQITKENEHEIVFYTNTLNSFTSFDSDLVRQFISTFHLKQNAIYDPSINGDVLGMTIITTQEHADSYYQNFNGVHYTSVNVLGLTHCFDVIRDHVNKGVAVTAFLDKLGYSKESSIAFGDGMNDKEMLMVVGEGFAMGNAHPDLFKYAKHETTDVQNSGIYNGLKSIGLVD